MKITRLSLFLALLASLALMIVLGTIAGVGAFLVGIVLVIPVAAVARFGLERPSAWMPSWRNPAIAVAGFVLGVGFELIGLPPIFAVLGWLALVWAVWRWAWRSAATLRLEAGEGTASMLNQLQPAIFRARWTVAGRRLGWRLAQSGWSPAPDAPVEARRPFAVAVDLTEVRARWLRPGPVMQGSPEWPATGAVAAAKGSGVWDNPEPMRQTVYAASGHGKTVLLTQYLLRVAMATHARVLFIDGKGSTADADDLVAGAVAAGLGVFEHAIKRWSPMGGDAISLLRGLPAEEALSLVRAMREAQTAGQKTSAFFEESAHASWRHALGEIPADEFSLARLRDELDGLDAAYAKKLDKEQTFGENAGAKLDTVVRPLLAAWESERGDGWSPVPGDGDDWNVGIVSAPVGSDGGRAMAAGVLMRLAAEVARSTGQPSRPLLVVVDECAAVMSSPLARSALELLLAQGRSAGLFVTLCFQDPGQIDAIDGAGEPFRRALETNSQTIWLGPGVDSARVLKVGGNSFRNEATRPGIGSSGGTSVRAQSSFGVDPSVVATLPTWCWAAYSAGHWVGVMVPPDHRRPAAPFELPKIPFGVSAVRQ